MWGWQLLNGAQKTSTNESASYELCIWGKKVVKKEKKQDLGFMI